MNWTRSSSCKIDTPMCVEAALAPDGMVRLRDSRRPELVLVLDPGDWQAFKGGVWAGDFDDLPTVDE